MAPEIWFCSGVADCGLWLNVFLFSKNIENISLFHDFVPYTYFLYLDV